VPNPQASQDATAEYREENDPIAEWLEEECETQGADAHDREKLRSPWATAVGDLHGSHSAWKKRRNEIPISSNRFGRAMTAKGFPEGRVGPEGARARLCIRLRSAPDQRPDEPGSERGSV